MDTSAWLRERRLERYEQPLQEHETDPEVVPGLTDGNLRELGILLGHRKKSFARDLCLGIFYGVPVGRSLLPSCRSSP